MALKPLIIIPARGGSKGIPHKNIVPLAGRPLIAWTIDVAREIADDRHIILSTDDDAIARVARDCGLPVDYMRPAELATDTAGSREVILDAMDWADDKGIDYDCVVLLQPTSPLRTAGDVSNVIGAYSPAIDMAVSVKEASSNPYYNCYEVDPEGFMHISKGDGTLTRRQDAPKAWEFNGAVYAINPESIRRLPMGRFAKRVAVEMPPERSVDIDTPLDLALAEAILKMQPTHPVDKQNRPQGV